MKLASRIAPRGVYYGWTLVVTLAVAETVSWGALYYAFTVFLDPMRQELGWSSASVAGAFSLGLLLSGLVAPPMGRWLDRHGPRLLMTVGSVAAAALMLAWSRVQDLTAYYLIWAGIGVAMGAVLYEPAFFVVATWFRRYRGQALIVLTFIAGFASVIFVPLAGWLVQTQGWRDALVTLAVILAAVTIPTHALALRRRPEDMGLAPDGEPARAVEAIAPGDFERSATLREAVSDSLFWLLTGAFFWTTVTIAAVFVYVAPYLTTLGYSPGAAATVVGLIGVAALPGRVVLTHLGNRLPRSWVTASIFLTQLAGMLALMVIPGVAGVASFVILFGLGFGAITPARAALVADYYGPAHFGGINGTVAFMLNLARAVAPVSAGVLYELSGGYAAVFWALVVVSALATALMWLTGWRYTRSRR
jgi:MFS family permease